MISNVPKLRSDLIFENVFEKGQKILVIRDPLGICPQDIALPLDLGELIKDLPNFSSVDDILLAANHKQLQLDLAAIVNLFNSLDSFGLLETSRLKLIREDIRNYFNSDSRPSVCSGNTYPNEFYDAKSFFNDFLNFGKNKNHKYSSILAPHIDFRVGLDAQKTYSNAFNNLNTDADLAIIFGTAHYRSTDRFMLTKKNFDTPLGTLETDREFIKEFTIELGYEPTFDDLAHRPEHSIELHAILLKHIFANKEIKILPILTGSFHDYFRSASTPDKDSYYMEYIQALKSTIDKTGRKTIILSSGDLAHIGRKFEDDFDAEPKLDQTMKSDKILINLLSESNQNEFYNEIQKDFDSRRICGLSPFYASLSLNGKLKCDDYSYGQWNERDTKSAVSFTSIGYL